MHKTLRAALVVTATTGALLAAATAADAHVVYDKGRLYQSDPLCVDGRSEISHGTGGGYSKVDTWARQRTYVPRVGWIQCGIKKYRPKGYIANRILVYKWLPDGSYGLCTYTNWIYNDNRASHFSIHHSMGEQPDCGRGWYFTLGASYVRWNSAWYGDALSSGWHYLPASEGSSSTPSDVTSIPTTTKVVDASGNVLSRTYSSVSRPVLQPTQPEPAQDDITADLDEDQAVPALRP